MNSGVTLAQNVHQRQSSSPSPPVRTEADPIHWSAVAVHDLGFARRLVIHDALQHVVGLLIDQIQVCIRPKRQCVTTPFHCLVW